MGKELFVIILELLLVLMIAAVAGMYIGLAACAIKLMAQYVGTAGTVACLMAGAALVLMWFWLMWEGKK